MDTFKNVEENGEIDEEKQEGKKNGSEKEKLMTNEVITNEVQERKNSLLPSWVLKMRSKIEESRLIHQHAEDRIQKINQDVSVLTSKLQLLQPSLPSTLNSSQLASSSLVGGVPQIIQPQSKNLLLLDELPGEMIVEIFQHLTLSEICRLNLLSKKYYLLIHRLDYWERVGFIQFYFLFIERNHYDVSVIFEEHSADISFSQTSMDYYHQLRKYRRQLLKDSSPQITLIRTIYQTIQQYQLNYHHCLKFMTMMKDQRCVPKHKQIHPRRHNRSERVVTHPLPLFESSNSSNTINPSASSLIYSDKIMSHAETLNSEFRSFAHQILEIMVEMTSNFYDRFNNNIIQEGVITVLVSLLANEEATIQNYSCAIIGNLFCWENLVKRKIEFLSSSLTEENKPSTQESIEKAIASLKSYKISLIDQLMNCNGHRQLSLLLTSPSASVNLAVGKLHNPHAPVSPNVTSINRGAANRRNTSNIEGVCNKHASRALICIFYPDSPVSSRVLSHNLNSLSTSKSKFNELMSEAVEETPFSQSKSNSSLLIPAEIETTKVIPPNVWKFSIPLPEVTTMNASILKPSPPSSHEKKVLPPSPSAKCRSTTVPNPSAVSVAPHQQLSSFQLFLLTDTIARPWQFTYFYKSGAFKDQFTAYLRFFSIHCIRGKGIDAIGYFTLDARFENDIIGQKLLLNKTYYHNNDEYAAFLPENAVNTEEDGKNDGIDALQQSQRHRSFLQDISNPFAQENRNPTSQQEEQQRDSVAHVKHLAYWSDGVVFSRNSTLLSRDDNFENNYYWSNVAERWSQGLWGVWETSTNQSHYELQKGGVFRAVPIESIDTFA